MTSFLRTLGRVDPAVVVAQSATRTPATLTIPLTAGAQVPIPIPGRFVSILDITGAATIQIKFGRDVFRTFAPGIGYPSRAEFDEIHVWNDSAGAISVTLVISDDPIDDNRLSATLFASMAASLLRLVPAGTLTPVAQMVVAVTGGGPATQVLAANANRKWAFVSMDLANVGNVYLGVDNTTTLINSFFDSMGGGTWREHYTGAVYACSDNGTEQVRAYETV